METQKQVLEIIKNATLSNEQIKELKKYFEKILAKQKANRPCKLNNND